MNACVDEMKTRARLGLNALNMGDMALLDRAQAVSGLRLPAPAQWKLRHTLTLVARSVGFRTWEQARCALGGYAERGDDMGSFWHAPRCNSLLNHWFASYASASSLQRSGAGLTLLPYRRQFMVVDRYYLRELGVDVSAASNSDSMDLVALYGSATWLAMCCSRLRAPEQTWTVAPHPVGG